MFTVYTPPTKLPVSVDDIEAELKIGSGQTERIKEMLKVAVEELQAETERQFMEATLIRTLEHFPSCGEIELWVKPVSSITHIKYYDADNTLQTLASSSYRLVTLTEDGPPRIERTATGTWPAVYCRGDAVQVTFVAGDDDQTEVMVQAKRALKEKVKAAYFMCEESPIVKRLIQGLKWSGA